MVVVDRQSQLLEVVGALHAAGRLAGGLHRRQEQGHQDADNGDHDEELDERETRGRIHNVELEVRTAHMQPSPLDCPMLGHVN